MFRKYRIERIKVKVREGGGYQLGTKMPNFEADSTEGRLKLYDFMGDSWCIIFSHPRDFTPVCTTELAHMITIGKEFERRNIKLLGLSCDDVATHVEWAQDIVHVSRQNVDETPFPIIADPQRHLAVKLGMLDPDEKDEHDMPLTCRAVFVIGSDKTMKTKILYPATTGRNFGEILRVVDSLMLTVNKKVATPADWEKGDEVMVIPSLSDEEAKKLFSKVNTKPMPSGRKYMRFTTIESA